MTGDVALFVEEVTRLLLERGERGDVQTIPPTAASLAARLGRLAEAHLVLSRALRRKPAIASSMR